VFVEHDVEAQDFETHVACDVVGLAGLVVVAKTLLHAEERFNKNDFDFLPDEAPILPLLVEPLFEPLYVALTASAVIDVVGIVLHEVLVEPVDCLVG